MHQIVDVLGVGRGARDETPDGFAVTIVKLAEGTDFPPMSQTVSIRERGNEMARRCQDRLFRGSLR